MAGLVMPQSLLGGGAMQLPDLASLLSLPGARVEVSRELRYCEAFRCRTILFRPRAAGLASWTQCPVSGCILYGELDTAATFTGDSVAWVYPDHRTALLGELMLSARFHNAWRTVKNLLRHYVKSVFNHNLCMCLVDMQLAGMLVSRDHNQLVGVFPPLLPLRV